MAQQEPFFTGSDPDSSLYRMPEDFTPDGVYNPTALDGPDLPFAGADAPEAQKTGSEAKSQEK